MSLLEHLQQRQVVGVSGLNLGAQECQNWGMGTYDEVEVLRYAIARQQQESSYLEDSLMGLICYAHGFSEVALPQHE